MSATPPVTTSRCAPGRIPAGASSDALVSLTDLLATAAATVGRPLRAGEGEDSYDLLPILLARPGAEPPREAIVMHSLNGNLFFLLVAPVLRPASRPGSVPMTVEITGRAIGWTGEHLMP